MSQKVVTVGNDGHLAQYPLDPANLKQHWFREHPDEAGPSKIVSRTSNQVIDAIGGQLVDNTQLQLYADTGNPNQRWRIVDMGEGGGPFFIHADDTDEVWDVSNASLDDGALIQLYGRKPEDNQNQMWDIEGVGGGEAFQFLSRASNLVLDLPGFSQDDGTALQQNASNRGFNQFWEVLPTNGTNIIRCVCSVKVLDYPKQAALDLQPGRAGQYAANGGQNQEWFINNVGQDGFGRDIVTIVSAVNGFFMTAINDGSVSMYPDNGGGPEQQWVMLP